MQEQGECSTLRRPDVSELVAAELEPGEGGELTGTARKPAVPARRRRRRRKKSQGRLTVEE